MGPLPTTESGQKYILVVGDYFSKWTEAFPLPNQEAKTVAEKLVHEVIARYGAPEKIHSDQGRNFEAQLFQEMCILFNMDKTRTSPYHPESDGMVERNGPNEMEWNGRTKWNGPGYVGQVRFTPSA